jgi:hypothetical protein
MRSFTACTRHQVKDDEIDKACSMQGMKMGAYNILIRKPEGKEPIGRPSYR